MGMYIFINYVGFLIKVSISKAYEMLQWIFSSAPDTFSHDIDEI